MSQRNPVEYQDTQTSTDIPANQMDLYQDAIQPAENDRFFQETNLGLGNYDPEEYWQQMQAFRDFMFADAAFTDTITDLAIYETKWQLGKELLAELERKAAESDDPPESLRDLEAISHRRKIQELGRKRWRELGREAVGNERWQQLTPEERRELTADRQLQALEERAGMTGEWTSPQGRMITARHEASRSRNARLLDNLFGRKKEIKRETSEIDDDSDGILLGRGDNR